MNKRQTRLMYAIGICAFAFMIAGGVVSEFASGWWLLSGYCLGGVLLMVVVGMEMNNR